MKRMLTMIAAGLLCATPAGADVTVTQTMTIKGGMAAKMDGMMPRMVMRIRGMVSRTDIEVMGQTVATITNLEAGQLIVLNGATRTAHFFGPGSPAIPGGAAALPKFDMTFKTTGRSETIEGVPCEEHVFTMDVNMGEMGGSAQVPPEAAAAMKDVRMAMSGSLWIATSGPGVADYVNFQKAATDAKMITALTGITPGQAGGLDRLIAASAGTRGLPYLTEMTMSFEGSGKMVEMMKQMGPIQMTQRITSVSTDAIADELFEVPGDYKIVKQ